MNKQSKASNKPVISERVGMSNCSVFLNEGKDGTKFVSFSLSRARKSPEGYKYGNQYYGGDWKDLAELITRVAPKIEDLLVQHPPKQF